MADTAMTAARFAKGMTFDEYVTFTGSAENLAREGFDVRRFSSVRPRLDWSGFLRERYAKAALGEDQTAAIRWLVAQPGGPAKILVLSEDWSSDCRRDVPYLARLAAAGGLELRIFARDGNAMLMKGLPDPGSTPNADLVHAYASTRASTSSTATSSTRPSITRRGSSATCAPRGTERRRTRPSSGAGARSASCSNRRSSTCGQAPGSTRS